MVSILYKPGPRATLRLWVYGFIVLALSNLGALTDAYLHPNIAYWDDEHLIVGGLSGTLCLILLGFFEAYLRKLYGSFHLLATERKAAELEKGHARDLKDAIVSSSIDAFIRIDAYGRVLEWSPTAARMFGWPAEQILGRPLTESIIPAQHHQAHNEGLAGRRMGGAGSVVGRLIEVSACRADGSALPVELQVSEVYTDDECHYLAFVRDISERKATAFQLLQSQKLEAVGQLTGGLAHDFNNLLAVVIGNLELVQEMSHHNERAPERIQAALSAAQRGANLTKSLLTVARSQHLTPELIDLRTHLGELMPLLRATAGSGISVRGTGHEPDAPPLLISVDIAGLDAAILNLINNARDALPGYGEITLSAGVRRVESNEAGSAGGQSLVAGDYVRITVADNGPGISPAVRARAFDVFFTTKDRSRGTGLGLAMALGFCRQSGGDAQIDPGSGPGASVSLWLPRLMEAPVPLVPPVPHAATPLTPRSSARVLVVDDEPELLELTKILLVQLGYAVSAYPTGEAALTQLVDGSIDLLVSDIVMPGMGGGELVRRARELQPGLPVLFLSGFAETPALGSAPPVHIERLEKPFSKLALAAAVERALEVPASISPSAANRP